MTLCSEERGSVLRRERTVPEYDESMILNGVSVHHLHAIQLPTAHGCGFSCALLADQTRIVSFDGILN